MSAPDLHASFEELAVGHALGALEPEDELVFLGHLTACARCERVVAEHLDTMAHLAYATDPAAPPASLWEAIRVGVEASPRASTFPGADEERVGFDDLSAVRRRREARRQLTKRFVAATSVAAGFALVLTLVVQNVSLREQQREEIAYGESLARVVSTYGSDVKQIALTASPDDKAATAVAVVQGDRLHLLVDTLKANDRDETVYVLWEQTVGGDVTAVGTFDVTGDHDVEVVEGLRLPDAAQLKSLMVTHERGRTAPSVSFQPALAVGTLA